MTDSKRKDTRLVHGGRRKEWTFGIVNPPVFHASTVLFDTVAELKAAASKRDESLYYGRRGTPTTFALADALTEISGGAGTVLYPSGLAALTGAILAFVEAGDHILVTDSVYDPTRAFCDQMLRRYGVETTYYDPLIGGGIADLIRPNTRLVLVEAPGSLTMEVQDIPAIAAAAHDAGALVFMDNTWATPLFFDAFAHGVDVSILALTKYVVGHADAMMGAATANQKALNRLRQGAGFLGNCPAPDDVYLALRGLRTLSVRLRQHEASALQIAKWIAERPEVDHVRHPALPTCPGHEVWKRDFTGSSGLFSFVPKNGTERAVTAFLEGMEHFKMGFSWGGYESLALGYFSVDKARTATPWTAGPLIRLHIGLEDPEDLKEDLDRAFARYRAAL